MRREYLARVIPTHRLLIARVIVIGRFLRRDKDELMEVRCVVALDINFGQRLREALCRSGWQEDLVGVYVNEPVGIERRGQPHLARALLPNIEHPGSGQRLDPDQSAASIPLRNRNRIIGGFVVDEINLEPLPDEVLYASGNEAFLIVSGK